MSHGCPEHLKVSNYLYTLSLSYSIQGKYSKAEQYLQRALQIRAMHLKFTDPDLLECMQRLAEIYSRQKKHAEADKLFQ